MFYPNIDKKKTGVWTFHKDVTSSCPFMSDNDEMEEDVYSRGDETK